MAEAIVVLGCRIGAGGTLSKAAQRRADHAAAAALRGGGRQALVVAGGKRWFGVSEANAIARYLATTYDLPYSRLILEQSSHSTFENAWYVARLLGPTEIRRVRVVTCDFHAPRAVRNFRAAGFQVMPESVPASHTSRVGQAVRAARERLATIADVARWSRVER